MHNARSTAISFSRSARPLAPSPRLRRRHTCSTGRHTRGLICSAVANFGGSSEEWSSAFKTSAMGLGTSRAVAPTGTILESENEDGSIGKTEFVAEATIPTYSGEMTVFAYRHTHDDKTTEPIVIASGELQGVSNAPCRVHDACFTGEVLGSQKFDCSQQLKMAIDYIKENGPGLVIYLQQEGRGIGLANKIHAYRLQEMEGLDTVDANRALGLPDDCREYSAVRNILQHLGVKSVALLTNNPRKITKMNSLGINVESRIPIILPKEEMPGPLAKYLAAKAARMNHQIESDELPEGVAHPPANVPNPPHSR